ncbi:MAG: hypothetical protein ACFBRM_12925 [Pikeienuella sp.]
MWIKTFAAGIAGLAIFGAGLVAAPAQAQDIPNVLVMTEDFDKDTVPRNSRVQRNILSGLNDRLNIRGYSVFDETAVNMDGYQATSVLDRQRRTPQELIAVARTVPTPIDIIVVYEVFASVDKTDFASFASMRIAGRVLNVDTGQFVGSFEVASPTNAPVRLPVNCPRECLLEKLSDRGRDMGIELASVLADKLDQFFGRMGGGAAVTGGGGYQQPGYGTQAPVYGGAPNQGAVGFERAYTLVFQECSPMIRLDFEPYLVIFEGYMRHRPAGCTGTACRMQYVSMIDPGKLQRNLEKMLIHSNHPGRVSVQGATYTVNCIPQRQRHPVQLDPQNW